MNSVHEPGPNADSETLPSRKTRSKNKPGARAPKLAQLALRHTRCVQAWSYCGRAWPCRGRGPRPYYISRLPCRSAHPRAPARRAARAVPRVPARRVVRVASAPASYRGRSATRQRRVVGVCARSCACYAARD